ncbi:MAG: CHASE domain-containing protein [Gammaproteobacteria bacterium]|nr:CHASE domain-containing protein [Gammaproteobacteria bacterium]MBU1730796.1 CHASE domain-containing protein [Gammaproteobacteria bacterium]MBU1891342.1 CHASE domain-containing protein [Gammaproteobacteria bacterium]
MLTFLTVRGEIRQSEEQLRVQFEWRAQNEAVRFQRSLERVVEAVDSVGGYMGASEHVDDAEFALFASDALHNHAEFRALQWLPYITADKRPAFEVELGRVRPGARITEFRDGEMITAGMRDEYIPIRYTEPFSGNEAVFGFDAATQPSNLKSLALARDMGTMSTSGLISLVQDSGQQAVILYRPVYGRGMPVETVDQRRDALLGFSAGVLLIKEVLNWSLQGTPPTGLDIHILDLSATGEDQLLYRHASRSRSADERPPTLEEVRAGQHKTVNVNVPGREWQLVFNPAPAL